MDQITVVHQFADQRIDLAQTEGGLRTTLQVAAHETIFVHAHLESCRASFIDGGIAHFLFETDAGESQVYLADGSQLRIYSTAASALLLYAHRMLEVLQQYYARNLERRLMR